MINVFLYMYIKVLSFVIMYWKNLFTSTCIFITQLKKLHSLNNLHYSKIVIPSYSVLIKGQEN